MSEDSDWFEALAGREAAGGSRLAATEGRLLRRALQRMPAQAPHQTPEQAQALRESLLDRARARGLMRQRWRWCPSCRERWQRWRQRPAVWLGAGLVLAGLFAAVAVLRLVPQPSDPPEESILRAPADGIWLLRVADPQAQRNDLADRLVAAGAKVQRYERLGRYGVDAEVPLPLAPQVKAALSRLHVAPAADGSLRVEFEPAAR